MPESGWYCTAADNGLPYEWCSPGNSIHSSPCGWMSDADAERHAVTVSTPKRIQLRRTKGWRKPEGAIVVARPSRWGNPFTIDSNIPTVFVHDGQRIWWETPRSDTASDEARVEAVRLFELHTGPLGNHEYDTPMMERLKADLAGHDLACWCPLDGQPCHANILLALANDDDMRGRS